MQRPVLFDEQIEKPSFWKEHPNFKRKLPFRDADRPSDAMENLYEISLYSGKFVPSPDDIQKNLDVLSPEDETVSPSRDVEEIDQNQFDDYSYLSYVVETSVHDDAIENRYLGLMNIPAVIEWDSVGSRDDFMLGLVKCGPHDDEESQVSDHSGFSTLWNKHIVEPQTVAPLSFFHENCETLCISSPINEERPETFDERIFHYEHPSLTSAYPIDVSSCAVDEREDIDYILSISRSCDYSVMSKSSECSAVLISLKEKKRRLESRFMKNDLYSIHAFHERVEVCHNLPEYPRSQRLSAPPNHLSNCNSKMKRENMLPKQETAKSFSPCCGLFSNE